MFDPVDVPEGPRCAEMPPMMRRQSSRQGAAAVVAALALLSTACTSQQGPSTAAEEVVGEADVTAFEGTVDDEVDLSGQVFWIGGSESTSEDATNAILAQLAIEMLRAAGAEVEDQSELGNPFIVRESLLSGEIDLAWEGVAVAWTVFLREPEGDLDGQAITLELGERDLSENGVAWLTPVDFATSGGFAMSAEEAAALDIATLSEMAAYVEDADDEATVCVTSGFVDFPVDGRVEYEEKLGVNLADGALRVYDPVPIYPDTGVATCTFGLVDAASGRIPQYDLVVLTDDVGLFLPNLPAMAIREDVLAESPELAAIFATLSPRLTAAEIRQLNQEVVVDGMPVDEVAKGWLVAEGLIAGSSE
jgi:osmoprotectant transport system substrate-binding protein